MHFEQDTLRLIQKNRLIDRVTESDIENLAMAYVDPAHAAEGAVLEVLLIGQSTRAIVCKPCLFDPENTLPKGIA